MRCDLCDTGFLPDRLIAVPGHDRNSATYIRLNRPHNKDALTLMPLKEAAQRGKNKSIQKSRAGESNRKPSA